MSSRSIRGRAIAFVLAALIIGFAPLVHAMCVGETHTATSAHMMADGSSMVMPDSGDASADDVSTGIAQASAMTQNSAMTQDSAMVLIALSLAPAFLVLLGFRLARRSSRDSLQIEVRRAIARWRPPPIFHQPTMVDSLSLGISRT
jgi:hypothetical protein